MGRAGRMRNQGLGAAQADRELDELQAVEQTKRLRLPALHRKAEGRSRAIALPVENGLARIVRGEESEVVHARDLRVAGEKLGDLRRVLRGAVHAQRQRL